MMAPDPKLLYAIEGVRAFRVVQGTEESLASKGPQTLSLLMVPTSPHDDFYLHLHMTPDLDLPMPTTAQMYHKPPSSYLIPRWDQAPDSGAFVRLEFPAVGSRPGVQEDIDTFETILAQCTAFLERARPPVTTPVKGGQRDAHEEEPLPPYNPADYDPGQGYVAGSQSSDGGKGGRIVLVDEEDGSVVGELGEGYHVVADDAIRPGSKDPVEISLPTDGSQQITVQPATFDDATKMHPAYKKSTMVSTASKASRLIMTTSDYVSKTMHSQAESYTQKSKPTSKPVTFSPSTHANVRRINKVSSKAAGISASTAASIGRAAQNFGAHMGRKKDGSARGYDKDGNVIEGYKPGVLNRSFMAFNTVVDGVEQAGRNLLTSTTSSVTTVVEHRWGEEAGDVSRSLGGGVKNVALVYIDVSGVSRKGVLKRVAKGMVVGKVRGGGQVVVGGGDGGELPVEGDGGSGSNNNNNNNNNNSNNSNNSNNKNNKNNNTKNNNKNDKHDGPEYKPAT
ncbi:SPG20 protein [Ophiocordyceps camponoti-floridani]|uniref:SPG20 protein n=1 Tax=Ophiocordyceps camponoti-floridani TaxID=2030778 RepID=A0A8H4VBN6_9HYPO|nr:SPG20 protein [Ophiocordyceps camponoti-floridani]